jgi:hypothetical protein
LRMKQHGMTSTLIGKQQTIVTKSNTTLPDYEQHLF